MIVFGDMVDIVCNMLGQDYRFEPKANETFTIDRGGYRSNDDANQVGSQGTLMDQKNWFRGKIEGPILASIQAESNLNAIAASTAVKNWTFTHKSGAIYRSVGGGIIVGDIQNDGNAGTINLAVAASKFEQIGG